MSTKQILLLTFSLTLGACSNQTTNSNSPEPSIPTKAEAPQTRQHQTYDGRLNHENVQIEFEESAPGIYYMVISWPNWSHGVMLSLDDQKPFLVKDHNFFRQPILHSSKVSVDLITLNEEGTAVSSYYTEAQSPYDLMITKDIHLTESTSLKANRIFFVNDSKIHTRGHNLSIEASLIQTKTKIHADKKRILFYESHILTRFPGETAKSMSEIVGSIIQVRAKKAIGQLNVAMVGINGNDHMFGGRIGSLDVYIDDHTDFRLGAMLLPGLAGKGPWAMHIYPNNFVLECDKSTHVDESGYIQAKLEINQDERALCLSAKVRTNTEGVLIYDATSSDPKRKLDCPRPS